MKYKWIERKKKGKVHILRADGLTWCKVENMGPGMFKRLSQSSETYPESRQICSNCQAEKALREYEMSYGQLDEEYEAMMQDRMRHAH